MPESKAIVPVSLETYTLAKMSPSQIHEVLTANFGGQSLDPVRDLDRVKMPAGGSTTWEIPTLTGLDASKELSGVVVHFQRNAARWNSTEITGMPPVCQSRDGHKGIGDPGGDCASCPCAAFGGDCKPAMRLFMLRESALVPLMMSLPRMSIKGFIQYLTRLTTPYFNVVTTIALEKATSKLANAPYAKAIFTYAAPLDAVAIPIIDAYRKAMVPVLQDMPLVADEFGDGES